MLKQSKAARSRQRKRKKARYATQFGSKSAWIRQLNCCACGHTPSEPHHVRSRGAGGTSKDLVPLCGVCHRAVHSMGAETFQERMRIDLTAEAAKREEWWQEGVTTGSHHLGF